MNALFMLLSLALLGAGDDSKIAVDWRPRENQELQKQINEAAANYAAALAKPEYSEPGARTLQALGLLAALPRLSPEQQSEYRPKIRTVIKAERAAFWPGPDRDATALIGDVHPSSSYHLPLILLLLEHEQAGSVEAGGTLRDRELRFGIRPAKPVRKDVIRLLALLLATSYQADQKNSTFAGPLEGKALWGYRTFGQAKDSCLSPSGLAAVGLSAAVFGLNVLDYDEDDYKVTLAGTKLERKAILDRLAAVCTHLLFALASGPQPTNTTGLEVDTTHLDAESFQAVLAPNADGRLLMRVEQSTARPSVPAAIYAYRDNSHRGAYFSASAVYVLSVAARVLALTLEWAKVHDVASVGSAQYQFMYRAGHWTLTADGATWEVKEVPATEYRYTPLRLQHGTQQLAIDDAIAGALNGCVACMTVSPDRRGRTLRGGNQTVPQQWMQGASDAAHTARFAGLHAFALYKASLATGDGYIIGRWTMWEDLTKGFARPGFPAALTAGGTSPLEKAAGLAFGAMIMTRSFRTVFPKSSARE